MSSISRRAAAYNKAARVMKGLKDLSRDTHEKFYASFEDYGESAHIATNIPTEDSQPVQIHVTPEGLATVDTGKDATVLRNVKTDRRGSKQIVAYVAQLARNAGLVP